MGAGARRDASKDRELKQLRALMDMAALVNSTLNIHAIQRRSVDAAAKLLNSETASLILIDQETGELYFEVALKKGARLKQVRLRKGEGIAGWVVEHGIPQIIHDIRSDRRFFARADQVSGFRTKNMVCVPVKTREKILGVLEAVNKRKGTFSPEDMELLVAFSHHVALAIDNALLYEDNIRHLVMRLREEKQHARERERILKDLHDGIGGITTNISLLADLAQDASSLEEVRKTLSTISELSREGLSEIRCFMNSIDESRVDWHTLMADIRHYGSTCIEPHGIRFRVRETIRDVREPPVSILYLNLFRIYKEALANVLKHAKAKTVTVALDVRPERLLLVVKDDGVGLGKPGGSGRGLRNMKARAWELGGTLTVSSRSGTQVRLELSLPLRLGAEQ
ncbi:MAG: GAF domain-containing protein [Nitrospirae bacterium]|nr:GAF domain-containing protein [Nitrospirota bacterium]